MWNNLGAARQDAGARERQMAQPEKILVIDDNAENRALAKATLEDEGLEAVLAASGKEGLLAFESASPDCVLLDVRMPEMDGFAVCEKIRSLPRGANVPIVFLTALRDVDTFDRALLAGGDDFLTKPVRPTELVVRVRTALKLRRMSDELREHYDLVRRQRDDLMRLQLQKERLTAFLVHDLKSPVNSINLAAQVVLTDERLSEGAREAAQHIRSDARALLRLILNLLDISKSEEGALVPHPANLDLQKLVHKLADEFALRAEASGLKLLQDLESTRLHADGDLLLRVLENLLENAIRHTPSGGTITVAARSSGGATVLSVTDSGPGIPAEMRDKIFDRYVQVDAKERVVSRLGRGLGLTFCKLAVEAHGGKIFVEDASPGARFVITLPHVS
jgi:signal transduction histidine kinase